MNETTSSKNPYDQKIKDLTEKDYQKILETLKEKIHFDYAAYLNTCVHCGLCADACQYYLTYNDPESIPAYKLNLVSKVFKKYFTFLGKKAPGLNKTDQIKETGAQVVVTPCHNCIDQLMELNKHYKLGIEIKTVCEVVADAIVIEQAVQKCL